MKVLVTGGAGFLGSDFVRLAARKGWKVTVVDKLTYAGDMDRLKPIQDRIDFYNTDILDKEELKRIFEKKKPEAVLHFAAETNIDRSVTEPNIFMETNIIGTIYLLELVKYFEVGRFFNITSYEEYGEIKEGERDEDCPLNPRSPYAVSKASADMLGQVYWRALKLPVITVRLCSIYGPWQNPERLIPMTILKALRNDRIPVYGTGEIIREWLYLCDCIRAIFALLEKGKPGEVYNIGSGERFKVIDIVKQILELLEKPDSLIKYLPDRPGHEKRIAIMSEKIKNSIGWAPTTKFDSGLKSTIEWNLKNRTWLFKKLFYYEDLWSRIYKEE
ncbi:MAG TPA: dTDP-glucose 4,6-dehydratase [Thermodesulfovibrio thiophilus]|nr:dTDP-glucose 4,6-dehydratase [Thermodesulfovibrio thiophilus]HQA04223.1 dTDP-glucose 4,6-dehydratase [Thermodesulfovibrio thiophilus]HQD36260.1 dTDP-glucose 4,6-dehydratase [Thermodesulfovibrio thiophilus]